MKLNLGLRALAIAVACVGAGHGARAQSPGQTTFEENCSACHQKTGLGIKGAFPALAGDKVVLGSVPIVAWTVLNGRGGMPAFKSELSDVQIAGALTYVRSAWGNKAPPVKPSDVAAARARSGPPPAGATTPGALRH